MAGSSSRAKDARKAEVERFAAQVATVLAQAHEAAKAAYEAFAKGAKRTAEDHIADACGGASVVVYKPSYRLRTALKSMGQIEPGYQGAWQVSDFWRHVNSQSVTASEKACQAACAVLREHFPGEGEFYAPSRVD